MRRIVGAVCLLGVVLALSVIFVEVFVSEESEVNEYDVDDVFDYGNVRWGMTEEEVDKALGGVWEAEYRNFRGIKIWQMFSFSDAGLLKSIYLSAKEAPSWAVFTNALTERYGRLVPGATNVRNRGKWIGNKTPLWGIESERTFGIVYHDDDGLFVELFPSHRNEPEIDMSEKL